MYDDQKKRMVSWDIHVHFKISKLVWMKVQLLKKKIQSLF